VKIPKRRSLLVLTLLLAVAPLATAQGYVEREIKIPWVSAGPSGLDALLVYANLPGTHPLVVLTHGSARKTEDYARVSSWQQLPQALWFARRGWVALVVVRRGYGLSGGVPDSNHGGHCPQTDYQSVGEYAADDLRVAIDYARGLPQVDASHILVAGVSSGGFATVALTASPPRGLVAAISFAGGRGSKADHDVCNPDDLVHAFRSFGKKSRTPMLWIYSQNDKFFWPELAQKFDAAFRSQGGQDQFVLAPPDGDDGHHLFAHVSAWSATVDDFLKVQNLTPLAQLLPDPTPPNLPAPAGLSEEGVRAFQTYLLRGPHKAFAVSPTSFAMSVAQMTTDDARRDALERCNKASQGMDKCSVVYVDETAVPH
jgi:dienelactone hydrolase